MPVYNEQSNVAEAVDSILNQTFEDFEFIIIDGGSTDNTVNIINQYDDPRIHLIRENTPNGISAALNKGISASNYDLIMRMDADDRSLPHRMDKQSHILKNNNSVGLVTSWHRIIDREGEPITPQTISPNRKFSVNEISSEGQEFAHGSVMMRKNIVKSVGGYRSAFDSAEDLDLWLRMAEITDFHVIPKILYEHRVSPHQIARRKRQRIAVKYARKAAEARRSGETEPINTCINEMRSVESKKYNNRQKKSLYKYLLGNALLREGRRQEAISYFIQSLIIYPLSIRTWYKIAASMLPQKLRKKMYRQVQKFLR